MSKRLLWITAIVAACALRLVYPGNVPWIADEPELVMRAVQFNEAGVLADTGNLGSKGLRYGPLPTWIYQFFLLFTHDPVAIVVLRVMLVSAVTAASLMWLSATLKLHRWFVVAMMLSPYLWFYSRLIWDSNFAMPLCALATAAYADFLSRGRPWTLLLTLACFAAMMLVHPMSAAFVLGVGAHMLLRQRRALWQYRWRIVVVMIVAFVVALPYMRVTPFLITDMDPEPNVPRLPGWFDTLWGARYITATGLDYFFNATWRGAMGDIMGGCYRAAVVVSALGHALAWLGGLFAIGRWLGANPVPRDEVALAMLLVVAVQSPINGLSARYGLPQYFNATWIAMAMLAWLMMTRIAEARPNFGGALVGLHAAALGAVTLILILHIQATGGTRDTRFGPTLTQQMRVARQRAAFDRDSTMREQHLPFFLNSPRALEALDELVDRPARVRAPAVLSVNYVSDNPADAHLTLTVDGKR